MTLQQFNLYETNLFAPDGTTHLVSHVRTSANAKLLSIEGDTNDPPTEVDPTTTVPIRVSGTRKYGVTARHLVLSRLVGSSPNQYRIYRKVVIFTNDYFVQALSKLGQTVEYETFDDWAIVGGIQERYHLTLGA